MNEKKNRGKISYILGILLFLLYFIHFIVFYYVKEGRKSEYIH